MVFIPLFMVVNMKMGITNSRSCATIPQVRGKAPVDLMLEPTSKSRVITIRARKPYIRCLHDRVSLLLTRIE
ncbi:hypothetical protein KQX54_012633 [Cotesia glomerata]|uniref:Uncharacterized protein n=1 Tax=Cotesia glomerata TaxID=32391 RepID=A0AAV7J3W6_COTGL|nr:hypothetical protein KQX54_012633 [Cotesia glomerata]